VRGATGTVEEIGYEADEICAAVLGLPEPWVQQRAGAYLRCPRLRKVEARTQPDESIVVAEMRLGEAVAMVHRGEIENAAAICGLLAAADSAGIGSKQEVWPAG